jgi:ribosomal protein S18 acetylase RimI-like enzyme
VTAASFTVCRLDGRDSSQPFEEIAVLHSNSIHGGVLPLLGRDFLSALYREIAKSRWGSVHIARARDGTLLGFIVGTRDVYRCARGFTAGGYLRILGLLMRRVWSVPIASKLLDSLAYPFRSSSAPASEPIASPKHRAELLAIAVSEAARGQGVGRALVLAYEKTLVGEVAQYLVSTNTTEKESNAFYQAMGFERAGQKRHHDLLIQVYTKQVQT